MLVGVELKKDRCSIEPSMKELALLAKTAGAQIIGSITQSREKPDQKYFIGEGKLEELASAVAESEADLVIFDNELSPSQERNLEERLGLKVIDRTELILDIFAQHASSHEGRLQVELAQNQFMLTRLSGKGIMLSRLGGGIGTRGPGETKLEKDKRRIRYRISLLKKDLENIRKARNTRKHTRTTSGIKNISIIGYTNAGKSTLLNSLTKSTVLAEDKLFATLDTTTRKLYIAENKNVLLSDTVGFIQKLPHQLIDAFKATLDEVVDSDMLLHVVDASSPDMERQIDSVYNVLEELGAISKPMITVFNKADLLTSPIERSIAEKYRPSVVVSAYKRTGLQQLKEAISTSL